MVEISIGREYYGAHALCCCKHALIVITKFTQISKSNHLMPRRDNDVNDGSREIFIKKELHATEKLYGVSSKRASVPAKSNAAKTSAEVMLG